MSFRPMLRPGQGHKLFRVLRREGGLTAKGRPTTSVLKPQGEFYAIISQDSPADKDQHKQPGSPITYKLVQRGTKNRAKANDILERVEDGKRFLVKKDPRNPGELGHFLIYTVEERDDLHCRGKG